jgi:hypothetical protein
VVGEPRQPANLPRARGKSHWPVSPLSQSTTAKSGFGRVSFKSGDTVSVRGLLFNTMTTLTMVAEKVVSRSMSSGTADQLPIGRCLSAPKNEESKQARPYP